MDASKILSHNSNGHQKMATGLYQLPVVHTDRAIAVGFDFTGTPLDEKTGSKRRLCFIAEAAKMADMAKASNHLNPRDPDIEHHIPSKDMREQVAVDPGMFQYKNMGIHIVAESVNYSAAGRATVAAVSYVNGRHTLEVLSVLAQNGADLRKVRVPIHIYINFSEEEALDASRGLNASKKVDEISMENQAGKFNKLFDMLPLELHGRIERRSNAANTKGAKFDVIDLIKRLAIMNTKEFPSETSTPSVVYNKAGSLVKRFSDEKYQHLYPLIEDILNLEQRVVRFYESVNGHKTKRNLNPIPLTDRGKERKTWDGKRMPNKIARPTTTMSGYHSEITPPDALVFMSMAAFRSFIVRGKWVDGDGEKSSLPELWERYGEIACRAAYKAFLDAGTGAHFDDFGKIQNNWSVVEGAVLRAASK